MPANPSARPAAICADTLLRFERDGFAVTPRLLSPQAVLGIVPAVDAAWSAAEAQTYRQKLRVILGDDALQRADADTASCSPAARVDELKRRVALLPEGSCPFLQCFNAWRSEEQIWNLIRSPAVAGTAACRVLRRGSPQRAGGAGGVPRPAECEPGRLSGARPAEGGSLSLPAAVLLARHLHARSFW